MKNRFYIILWVAFFVFSARVQADDLFSQRCTLFFDNGVTIKEVFLAQTPKQKEKGLSGRKSPGNGMLFSFTENEPVYFWMHNTHFPLSIGFFDQDGQLFRITDMQADTDDVHSSEMPAKFALELPLGQFGQLELNEGIRLLKQDCQ